MKRTLAAIFAGFAAQSAEATDMHELNGYTSRFFPLQRIEIDSPAGPAKDLLVVPVGWISGRTEKGNSWVGTSDERYVVQIAAMESNLEGDGTAQRSRLLDELRSRYSRDVVIRQDGDSTFFEGSMDVPGGPGPARSRSLIRLWPQGDQHNMLQFHVIVALSDWRSPEAEDLVNLFRAQLIRTRTSQPGKATDHRPPRAAAGGVTDGAPSFVLMADLARRLGSLKTVSLDGYRFKVPSTWDTGRDDKGAPWAASPNRDYALERRVRVLPAGGDWRETIKRRGAEILRELTGTDISGELEDGSLERMFALQIPAERSEHAGFKAWHWPQLLHIDGMVVEAWLSLYVRQSLWHASGTEDLEQLLGQQFTSLPPGDPRLVGSVKQGYGLDRLRPISAFGFIELNVPARWYDEYAEQGNMWVACEDEPDTGTLWIKYDLYGSDVDDLTVQAFAQPIRAKGAVPVSTPQAGRLLFHESHLDRENGEMLRFNR